MLTVAHVPMFFSPPHLFPYSPLRYEAFYFFSLSCAYCKKYPSVVCIYKESIACICEHVSIVPVWLGALGMWDNWLSWVFTGGQLLVLIAHICLVLLKDRVCPRIPRASIKRWGVTNGGGISNFQHDNHSCFTKINRKQAVLLCSPPTAGTESQNP